MVEVFFKTLPFFALIALGWGAGKRGFFSEEASTYLTRFVFYFALSAMLFGWSAQLSLSEVFSWAFVAAYLGAGLLVYGLVTAVARWRGLGVAEAAVEAQCGVVGNVGFLGVPMLALLLGQAAIGPVVLVLACDLIVFGSLIVILITSSRGAGGALASAIGGLIRNPMIVSISLGLI